jgi:NDP-sugar pyrophosphorylase family protein
VEAGAEVGPGTTLVAEVTVRSGARVRDSVLWKGVTVEAEASVEGALLGPGVKVGRHATVPPGAVLGEGTTISDHSRCA